MTNTITPKGLTDYYFPIKERDISYLSTNDGNYSYLQEDDNVSGIWQKATAYKGIVREDTEELISVVGKNYQLIPNQQLIEALLEALDKTDIKYNEPTHGLIGQLHNYVDNNKMKLTLTFPELKVVDDTTEGIHMSLIIQNSYDMSERIKLIFGMVRLICTNGAIVFLQEKNKFNQTYKHTAGFDLDAVKRQFDSIYMQIPMINERINILRSLDNPQSIFDSVMNVENDFGKRASDFVKENDPETMWALYNLLTYYVTHFVAVKQHTAYFHAISNQFRL